MWCELISLERFGVGGSIMKLVDSLLGILDIFVNLIKIRLTKTIVHRTRIHL